MAQEHFSQARNALERATLLAPNDAETHSDLGLVLMAQGQILEAKHTLRRAIHQQPDFAEAHYRLERVLAARNDAQHLMQSAQEILHTLFRRE